MAPEKDKVALIVPRDHLSTCKLRLVREKRGQQAANLMSQARVEVVEDQLWGMIGRSGVVLTGRASVTWHTCLKTRTEISLGQRTLVSLK